MFVITILITCSSSTVAVAAVTLIQQEILV